MLNKKMPSIISLIYTKKKLIAFSAAIIALGMIAAGLSLRSTAIEYYQVLPRDLLETVTTTGRVEAGDILELALETSGIIDTLPLAEGEVVKKGDILLTLQKESEESSLALVESRWQTKLEQGREKLLQARLDAEAKQKNYQRLKVLAESGAIATAELENAQRSAEIAQSALRLAELELDAGQAELEIKQAQIAVEQHILRAPLDGRVLSLEKQRGEYITPGAVVAKLGTQTNSISMEVDEKLYNKFRLGQKVLINSQAEPGTVLEAAVAAIAPKVDAAKGTISVKAAIKDGAGSLKPDSAVNAEIFLAEDKQVLAVPEEYLIRREGKDTVLLWAGGEPISTPVIIEKSYPGWAVVQGLSPDSTIINPRGYKPGTKYRLDSQRSN